jgi:hypothetical protein
MCYNSFTRLRTKSRSGQIGQHSSVDPIILVPCFEQVIFQWITHQRFCGLRFEQYENTGAH